MPATLLCGFYMLQQSGAGIELGSVVFLGQFSLGRGDLLFRLCESGRHAANLRDEFLKGGAVPSQEIARRKVNQRLSPR